jgi:hypothetical protein
LVNQTRFLHVLVPRCCNVSVEQFPRLALGIVTVAATLIPFAVSCSVALRLCEPRG